MPCITLNIMWYWLHTVTRSLRHWSHMTSIIPRSSHFHPTRRQVGLYVPEPGAPDVMCSPTMDPYRSIQIHTDPCALGIGTKRARNGIENMCKNMWKTYENSGKIHCRARKLGSQDTIFAWSWWVAQCLADWLEIVEELVSWTSISGRLRFVLPMFHTFYQKLSDFGVEVQQRPMDLLWL